MASQTPFGLAERHHSEALLFLSGQRAACPAPWFFELFIVAFESLPLVEFPQNLLKDAHLSVDRIGAYFGAPQTLIHPDMDGPNLVDWLITKEAGQRLQCTAIRIRGARLDVKLMVRKPSRRRG